MSDRKTSLDGLEIISQLLCCALWGLNQVAAKPALADVPPQIQAGSHSLGAALPINRAPQPRQTPHLA